MQINRLVLKLFTPHNVSYRTETVGEKGKHIEMQPWQLGTFMEQFCAEYQKAYPGHEFAVRLVGRGRYNIVWIGEKEAAIQPREGPQVDDL